MGVAEKVQFRSQCSLLPEFSQQFQEFCLSPTSIFVPVQTQLFVGNQIHFRIVLSDGRVMLEGRAVITDPDDRPFNLPGIFLEISDLQPMGRILLNEMIAASGDTQSYGESGESTTALFIQEEWSDAVGTTSPGMAVAQPKGQGGQQPEQKRSPSLPPPFLPGRTIQGVSRQDLSLPQPGARKAIPTRTTEETRVEQTDVDEETRVEETNVEGPTRAQTDVAPDIIEETRLSPENRLITENEPEKSVSTSAPPFSSGPMPPLPAAAVSVRGPSQAFQEEDVSALPRLADVEQGDETNIVAAGFDSAPDASDTAESRKAAAEVVRADQELKYSPRLPGGGTTIEDSWSDRAPKRSWRALFWLLGPLALVVAYAGYRQWASKDAQEENADVAKEVGEAEGTPTSAQAAPVEGTVRSEEGPVDGGMDSAIAIADASIAALTRADANDAGMEAKPDAGLDAALDAATAPETEPTTEPIGAEPLALVEAPKGQESEGECRVRYKIDPKDSDLWIDGTRFTRAKRPQTLRCGEHRIKLDHPRYAEQSLTISPEGGELEIAAKLRRPQFRLRVKTVPSGAKVVVGGKRLGKSPASKKVTGFERLTLKVSKSGFRSHKQKIYLKGDESITINLKSKSRRGR